MTLWNDIVDLVARGGPVMAPIIAASIIALAVFAWRAWALRRARVAPREVIDGVVADVRAGRVADALGRCAASPTPAARVLAAGLRHHADGREVAKERIEEVGRVELGTLDRYVGIVGVIATIEPLLGLLGTVTGMIGVFQDVVSTGVGDPSSLAAGIWEALITTAAGLVTGIPALLGHRLLLARVDARAEELEAGALAVLDALDGTRRGRPGSSGDVELAPRLVAQGA